MPKLASRSGMLERRFFVTQSSARGSLWRLPRPLSTALLARRRPELARSCWLHQANVNNSSLVEMIRLLPPAWVSCLSF